MIGPVTFPAYRERPARFHEVREIDGWRLKVYSIVAGADAVDWNDYRDVWDMGAALLPRPARTDQRHGLGFCIAHSNVTAGLRYFVVCWWDNANELPIRVFVRGRGETLWRAARASESVCVWDLEVIWFERNAYVETVLTGTEPDWAAYLARVV
ncbi:MAG TPA: hypothetical protein VGA37_10320 [Gemmatimonadales bacterium]